MKLNLWLLKFVTVRNELIFNLYKMGANKQACWNRIENLNCNLRGGVNCPLFPTS